MAEPAGPLVVEFEVRAGLEHAFEMWTGRVGLWWPASHTVSGSPEAIVFEPHPGGRIFERTADGVEHPWGEVLDWEPPRRLRYRWHLFFEPSQATEVEVVFTRLGGTGGNTGEDTGGEHVGVRIVQRGWERLGAAGALRRTRTGYAWAAITPLYARACC
jgi:uncharacterized protein YndB with AHSA1/START domain